MSEGDRVVAAFVRCVLAAGLLGCMRLALAEPEPAASETFAIHGQLTYVEQETDAFFAPYRGPNSLSPDSGRETVDATLYLGARLWSGAEAWINGEVDQGFGLNDTLGLAGFPSGAAYKVGKKKPYLRLPRAFLRDTIDLDDAREPLEAGPNQLGGAHSANRLVVTVGKFAVTDVFDTSTYAHDPRADFMNWAAVDAGTFDYAADAWGYSIGAAVEWYHGDWTLRAGLFDLSTVPNGEHLTPGGHQFEVDLEAEHRQQIRGAPGRLLLTVFGNRGRMGLLDDAVQLAATSGAVVEIAPVRRYRGRTGAHLTLEQQLTADVGIYARAGSAAGNVEAYEFADIDRTASAGVSIRGTRWGRAGDTVGIAAIVNGISAARQRYLDAGGLGILVGDGRLPHPGSEQALETYYALALTARACVTFDYQHFANPAYNRDRGPVSVFTVRLHAQF
jgi:high affinity Mn2+ porin